MPLRSLMMMLLLPIAATAHAAGDTRAIVQHALERVVAAGGFRAQASGQLFGPDLPAMSGEVDVIFPDRIHARTDSMEFIVTPQGAWVSALGLWTPADRSMLPVTAFDPAAMRKAIRSVRDAREDGTSKTAQCAAHVYRFRASGQLPGADSDGDVRLWVCDDNGRAARLEAIGRSGGKVAVDFDWTRRPRVEAPD